MAGMHAAALARGESLAPLPRETALGSLCHYISGADPADYQPANITFDLLPQLDEATRHRLRRDKKARHALVCRRALEALDQYIAPRASANGTLSAIEPRPSRSEGLSALEPPPSGSGELSALEPQPSERKPFPRGAAAVRKRRAFPHRAAAVRERRPCLS